MLALPPGAVGLGAMRLSTAEDRDEARAEEVIEAALAAGVALVDTAPSYALSEDDLHHNERLVGRLTRGRTVLVATKAALTREGTRWVVDGRRNSILRSAEASAAALGRAPDLLLLHAIDPAVPLGTSVRALAEASGAGLARAIGICCERRSDLDTALEVAELVAVQLPLSVWDDGVGASGLLTRARALGLTIFAHTPLGGPPRARRLASDPVLSALAAAHQASAASVALAYVVGQGAVPLVGASSLEHARSLARLPTLGPDEHAAVRERFRPSARAPEGTELVLLVGSPGAGKSTVARALVADGFEHVSRDVTGGSTSGLAKRLAARLIGPDAPRRVVVDNTHPSRKDRAILLAAASGARARAIWLDVPMRVAQANAARRAVEVLGRLPTPEELRASKDPRVVPPRALFGFARAFEPPAHDEGFVAVERRAFVRRASGSRPGIAIAARSLAALPDALVERARSEAALIYGWAPRGESWRAEADARGLGHATLALCPHGEGPPVCWCRPPLPGLVVAWLVEKDVDPSRAILFGAPRIDGPIAEGTGLTFAGQ
jgi:pyridoxine 4-dehydrogenase